MALIGVIACTQTAPQPEAKSAPAAPAAQAPAAPAAPGGQAGPPAAPASRPALPTTPVTVKVGVLDITAWAGIFVADDRGYFKDVGITIEKEAFQSGTEMRPGIVSGQLPVGGGGLNAGTMNLVGREADLKIVASMESTREGQPSGSALVVRKELWDRGVIRTGKDLEGREVFGPGGSGSGLYASLLNWANKQGLDKSRSPMTNMGTTDTRVALANGSIDVATLGEPFFTLGENNGSLKRWISYYDLVGNVTVSAVLYGTNFLQDRGAGAQFMEAWLRGVRDYEDAIATGRELADIESIVTKPTNTSPAVFEQMSRAKTITWIPPDGGIDVKPWAQVIEVWKGQSLFSKDFQADSVVDNSFAQQAATKLGPYKPRS